MPEKTLRYKVIGEDQASGTTSRVSRAVSALTVKLGLAALAYKAYHMVVNTARKIQQAFIDTLKKGTKAVMDEEAQLARLKGGLMSSGYYTKEAYDALKQYGDEVSRSNSYTKEQIYNAMAMISTFKKSPEVIRTTTGAVIGIAAALDRGATSGENLQQTAIMLGKGISGLYGAMRRVGIMVDLQKAKAQGYNAVLEEVELETKYIVEMFGKTLPGRLRMAGQAFGEVRKELVRGTTQSKALNALIEASRDVFYDWADGLKGSTERIEDLTDAIVNKLLPVIVALGITTIDYFETIFVLIDKYVKKLETSESLQEWAERQIAMRRFILGMAEVFPEATTDSEKFFNSIRQGFIDVLDLTQGYQKRTEEIADRGLPPITEDILEPARRAMEEFELAYTETMEGTTARLSKELELQRNEWGNYVKDVKRLNQWLAKERQKLWDEEADAIRDAAEAREQAQREADQKILDVKDEFRLEYIRTTEGETAAELFELDKRLQYYRENLLSRVEATEENMELLTDLELWYYQKQQDILDEAVEEQEETWQEHFQRLAEMSREDFYDKVEMYMEWTTDYLVEALWDTKLKFKEIWKAMAKDALKYFLFKIAFAFISGLPIFNMGGIVGGSNVPTGLAQHGGRVGKDKYLVWMHEGERAIPEPQSSKYAGMLDRIIAEKRSGVPAFQPQALPTAIPSTLPSYTPKTINSSLSITMPLQVLDAKGLEYEIKHGRVNKLLATAIRKEYMNVGLY